MKLKKDRKIRVIQEIVIKNIDCEECIRDERWKEVM